jgi:hypothetical protein
LKNIFPSFFFIGKQAVMTTYPTNVSYDELKSITSFKC